MSNLEEGFFQAPDGERLFYRYQSGASDASPLVLIHGHGEHSGRYLKFFTRLQDLGCPIATFDLRGCGLSGGPRVYVSCFEDYLGDVSSFLHFLKTRYRISRSISLFGHSLGGLIATRWAKESQGGISKLILSSPLFGIPLAPPAQLLVKFLNRFLPRFVIQNPVRPPFLTHDPEEVEKYKKDPLIQRRITVRLAHEMLRCTRFFQEGEIQVSFPVYILMAEQDFVVVPEATRQFFSRLRAPQKKLESFSGFFHEIFNEKDQEKAFERLRYYLTR